jgi:hypothetical protein
MSASLVKSDRHSSTCGMYYKSFAMVMYDRNDSTIVEPLL